MGVKGMDIRIGGMVVTQVIEGTCARGGMKYGHDDGQWVRGECERHELEMVTK